MTAQLLLSEPDRVDEPQVACEYSDVLTQVAAGGRPVIVRRGGADLAAVIPLEHLEIVREILTRQQAEELAAQLDWDRLLQTRWPPQQWLDDTDNPFESEAGPAP